MDYAPIPAWFFDEKKAKNIRKLTLLRDDVEKTPIPELVRITLEERRSAFERLLDRIEDEIIQK